MDISVLVGKTINEIVGCVGDERISFSCSDGSDYALFHTQDCCESVSVEDICGDLNDLIGSPVIQAEESSSSDENPPEVPAREFHDESFTWTFYRLATTKGSVVIRWYGSSNGYYSERVSFDRL